MNRRGFIKYLGLGTGAAAALGVSKSGTSPVPIPVSHPKMKVSEVIRDVPVEVTKLGPVIVPTAALAAAFRPDDRDDWAREMAIRTVEEQQRGAVHLTMYEPDPNRLSDLLAALHRRNGGTA